MYADKSFGKTVQPVDCILAQ